MNRLARALLVAIGALVLAACVAMPEQLRPGMTRAEIEQRLGAPTATHALAEGTRLQYSRQPAGQQVYNLDLDAQGRLLRVDQVLDTRWLQRIEVDRWTREDVLRQFGKPALVERVARFDGTVWTYRYLEPFSLARRVHIHMDPLGTVRRVVFTDEPVSDDPDNRD